MKVIHADARELPLKDECVQCVVTSPPYWGLRDYGVEGQIGLERTPEEYVSTMVDVFREVWRVLKGDGTLWLNLGDSYAGSWGNYQPTGKGGQRHKETERFDRKAYSDTTFRPPTSIPGPGLKPKDLCGIPWRVAFALQADGWYLRSDIIWHKPNPMPESIKDRPTKSHEYLFLFTKSARYYYDADAIKENSVDPLDRPGRRLARPGIDMQGGNQGTGTIPFNGSKRNKRSVWTIPTEPTPYAHFATFPSKLVEPCILAGSREYDTVLDPFCGSGTTLAMADLLDRKAVGCDLAYFDIVPERWIDLLCKRNK